MTQLVASRLGPDSLLVRFMNPDRATYDRMIVATPQDDDASLFLAGRRSSAWRHRRAGREIHNLSRFRSVLTPVNNCWLALFREIG